MNEPSEKLRNSLKYKLRIASFTLLAFHPKALNDIPIFTGLYGQVFWLTLYSTPSHPKPDSGMQVE
jgi:hypothetical protein